MLRLLTMLSLSVFAADPGDVFEKGLAAYQAHDYARARDSFREALDRDPATARLLHNLALTYYQLNQRPTALAYWRKALAIDPGFSAARTGRDLLENRMQMRPYEASGLDLGVNRALERVPGFPLSWAFAVLLATAVWLLARDVGARRTARDEEASPPGLPKAAVFTGLAALLCGSVLALKLGQRINPRATVVVDQARVKSLPTAESVTLFELKGGGEVRVRRHQGDWVQVLASEGTGGWVKNAELIETSDP